MNELYDLLNALLITRARCYGCQEKPSSKPIKEREKILIDYKTKLNNLYNKLGELDSKGSFSLDMENPLHQEIYLFTGEKIRWVEETTLPIPDMRGRKKSHESL